MPSHSDKPIAKTWYETHRFNDGVTLIQETHVASWLRCNIWHVRGRDRDLIIDTGMGLRPIKAEVVDITERPLSAIVTHTHFDHSGGLHEFETRCGHSAEADIMKAPNNQNTVADAGFVRAETFSALPWAGFTAEQFEVKSAPLTQLLDEGDVIDLGDRAFHVFHLPGHSPGSIALYEPATKILFSGDVIYDGALIDNLYHSNQDVYQDSLRRLKELEVSTVHGGHFGSFGQDQMHKMINEYFAGGRRLGNPEDWVSTQVNDMS